MGSSFENAIVAGGIGLALSAGGFYALWASGREPPDPVLSLPVVDATSLSRVAIGSEVLVEGRLAPGTPTSKDGLALRQREVLEGSTRTGENEVRFGWVAKGLDAAPFILETTTGNARVEVAKKAAIEEAPRTVGEDPGTRVAGKTRVVGFGAFDALTARGRVAPGAVLQATLLRGGSVAGHRAAIERSGLVGFVLGGVLALAGLSVLGIAARQLVVARRENAPKKRRTPEEN